MATLRERIQEQTEASKNGAHAWLDPQIGEFLEYVYLDPGYEWRSAGVLRKYPIDEELEAVYARYLMEKDL